MGFSTPCFFRLKINHLTNKIFIVVFQKTAQLLGEGTVLSVEEWMTVKVLHKKHPGMSLRELGRLVKCSHNTVKAALSNRIIRSTNAPQRSTHGWNVITTIVLNRARSGSLRDRGDTQVLLNFGVRYLTMRLLLRLYWTDCYIIHILS